MYISSLTHSAVSIVTLLPESDVVQEYSICNLWTNLSLVLMGLFPQVCSWAREPKTERILSASRIRTGHRWPVRLPCAGSGAGFDGPCGYLPTQDILRFSGYTEKSYSSFPFLLRRATAHFSCLNWETSVRRGQPEVDSTIELMPQNC